MNYPSPQVTRRRVGATGFACILALTGIARSQTPESEVSAADAPQKQFWARRETGYLPAADGTLLRYSVLLPAKTGRFPVALIYSGYDTGSIGGPAYLKNDVTFSFDLDRALVSKGYAVMGVNARATGCSEGAPFDFLGIKYGEDGRDAVEFAAQQPWSNGNVGMYGWSWAGMSQLATASERPAHLKAIVPGMVLGDPRLDNGAPGGVTAYAMASHWNEFVHFRWNAVSESANAEHDARCLEQLKKNSRSLDENSWGRQLIRHPLRDAFMDERVLGARTHLISVPVLSIETFQDEAVTSREGYYQETLDAARTWLLQSNGPHDLYESLELRKTLLTFLDRFVKGSNNGFERSPHLIVWMDTYSTGKGMHGHMLGAQPGWRFVHQELVPNVTPIVFSLTKGGRLIVDGKGEGEPDTYTYPTPGPGVNAHFETDGWEATTGDWRKGSVAYTSEPLDRDILTYGPASTDLWISSDAVDVDVQVTLTVVQPDGTERYLQRGWLRLSDRALDERRSTQVHPVLLDVPETMRLLNPDGPVLARVEINKLAAELPKGSRVRIWIDAPSTTGLYQFSYIAWPATNHVWHDAEHTSRLVMGELAGIQASQQPTCKALKEPCRPDPLAK
jgi:predicted acyl esterase